MLTAAAVCKQEYVSMPFNMTEQVKFKKEDFAFFVIFTDFTVMCILVAFGIWLEKRQNEFIEEFKEEAIQMDDYAVRISNLPPINFYKGDEHVLRALLLWHFHQLFLSEIEIEWEAAFEQLKEQLREQPQIEIESSHRLKINEDVRAKLDELTPFDYSAISADQLPVSADVIDRTLEENGTVFFGQTDFFTKSREGKGYQVFADGSFYEGCWKSNQPCGFGRKLGSDGLMYLGNWRRGKFHGKGAVVWLENSMEFKYKGLFKQGIRDGKGTLVLPGGEMLAGVWEDNLIKGKYTFRTSLGRVAGGYFNSPAVNAIDSQLEIINGFLNQAENTD